jgi:peptidylprolyl isomerase
MNFVKEGDKVQILCEAKLENGKICYKSEKETPLEIIVGEGRFFPAIETVLKGMKEGETRKVTLEPKDAFGPHNDDLVVEVPKNDFQSGSTLGIGTRVKLNTDSGKIVHGAIMGLKDEIYTIDFNHSLAGKRIVFTVTIISVVE